MSTELTWNQAWKEQTCILIVPLPFQLVRVKIMAWKGRAITKQYKHSQNTKTIHHLYLAVSISELSHVDLNAFGILQACTQKGNQTKQIKVWIPDFDFPPARHSQLHGNIIFSMEAKVWAWPQISCSKAVFIPKVLCTVLVLENRPWSHVAPANSGIAHLEFRNLRIL